MKIIVVIFAITIPMEAFLAPDVLAEQGRRLLALTNELRKEKNLPILTGVSVLDTSSQMRADDMSAKQYFSHVGPDGHVLSYFLRKAGYAYSTAGENLAVGFSEADEVVAAWEKSPTHYANLVDTEFQQIGIGLQTGEFEGKPVVFVAQHFGMPLNAPTAIAAASPKATKPAAASNVIAKAPTPVAPTPTPAPTPAPAVQPEPKPVQIPTPAPAASNAAPEAVQPAEKPVETKPAAPPQENPAPSPETAATSSDIAQTDILAEATSTAQILGTDIAQSGAAGTQPLVIIQNQSAVEWSDTNDHRTRIEVRAAIVGRVKRATATVNGTPVELQSTGNGMYTGSITLPESSDSVFKTVVGSSLVVTGEDGSIVQGVIDWVHPKLVSQNPVEKYFQAKSWLGFGFSVFTVSRWIYVFFIAFFMIALGLSIFIQIKKQHPHVIVQTMTLLGLLVCLYIV